MQLYNSVECKGKERENRRVYRLPVGHYVRRLARVAIDKRDYKT